ncbi:nicotinamide-nucleotide amidase [Persephonella hydrogeniphila]|uniref:CinA-like protein n=1 Tax=Persephonella hydrogeniphila TaxID=198703 RepID=A0A285NH01_9AQUI|nr:CinA family nicotinamide mononucleotide deamidase-related protein [Persephonella hydrogeniphila]SNZ07166.1 nicotinamide-nucleotide amidase [Persephonella hydrogeniphila]
MRFFIVITGTEFTTGLKQEKNSLYISKEVFKRGGEVIGIHIAPDDIYQIQYAIKIGMDKSDVVIVSGGLGPTEDDMTRNAISEAIGVPLIFDEEWLRTIKNTLKEQGREITENIKKMAKLPYGARKIENPVGKALGFIKVLDDVKKAIVAVPGVPSEMKPMVLKALDYLGLKEQEKRVHLFRTFGKPEAEINDILSDIEDIVLNSSPKGVDIFVLDKNEFFLENKVKVIRERLGELIYTEEEKEMEEIVGNILKEKGLTVSTAESSTGGLIATRIVNVPGASEYMMGGVVSYSNQVKVNTLGVKKEDIERYGAVSEPVAKQMAEGVKTLLKTDISVSDTGIAGPTGGTKEKPVGLHYIGYSDRKKTEVHRVVFKGERNDIRLAVSQYALNLIRLNLR